MYSRLYLVGAILIAGCRIFDAAESSPGPDDVPDASSDIAPDIVVVRDTGTDLDTSDASDAADTSDMAPDQTIDMAPDLPVCAFDQFDPIAHWSFDIPEAGTFPNIGSAVAPNAEPVGDPMVESTGSLRGNAVRLDGVDDGVLIPHATAFELAEGTLSFWVNIEELDGTNQQALLCKDHVDFGNGGHFCIRIIGGLLTYRTQDVTTTFEILDLQFALQQWINITITFGVGQKRIYIDGILQEQDFTDSGSWYDLGQNRSNREPFAIGFSSIQSAPGSHEPAQGFVNMALDEVMIFDRVMTTEEIQSLVIAAKTECPF